MDKKSEVEIKIVITEDNNIRIGRPKNMKDDDLIWIIDTTLTHLKKKFMKKYNEGVRRG